MQLTIKSSWGERGVLFLASYLGVEINVSVAGENDQTPCLNANGAVYHGIFEVVKALVMASKMDTETLIGASPLDVAEVSQWLSYGVEKNASLDDLDNFLSKRSYFASSHETIADIYLYWISHPLIEKVGIKKISKSYANLIRWVDQIQQATSMSKSKMLLPEIQLKTSSAISLDVFKALSTATTTTTTTTAKTATTASTPAIPVVKSTDKGMTIPPPVKATEGGDKKEVKKKKEKKAKKVAPKASSSSSDSPISKCDIKVGLVVSVEKHPDSEKLLVEMVDVGEGKPRTICSGIQQFVKVEDLQNRKVLVLTNLKPAKMGGVESNGMLLCASNADHSVVTLLEVPADAKIGERLTFEGHEGEPSPPNWMSKKSHFAKNVAAELKAGEDNVVTFKGVVGKLSSGVVKAPFVGAFIG